MASVLDSIIVNIGPPLFATHRRAFPPAGESAPQRGVVIELSNRLTS
jgi:hypothetical protein